MAAHAIMQTMTAQKNSAAPKRRPPAGLEARGRRLWREVLDVVELDPARIGILEEACRLADRLDGLDRAIRTDGMTYVVQDEDDPTGNRWTLVVDKALSEARQSQNVFKQMLAALRLPDPVSGEVPQRRPGAGPRDGVYPGKITALDRARAAS